MTPTNTTMSPEIKNIMDNEDVKHTVVPTPHTHSRDEVDGLVEALANKADVHHNHYSIYETKGYQTAVVSAVKDPTESNTTYIQIGFEDFREEEFYQYARISLANLNNLKRALLNPDSTPTADSDNLITSAAVKTALDEKNQIRQDDPETSDHAIVTTSAEEGDVYVNISVREDDVIKHVRINIGNIDNLARALTNPDSTPTANSNNLVLSGGVKAAIDDATKAVFGSLPYYITTAHEKMKVYTRVLHNNSGSTMQLFDCIDLSSLPAEERTNVWWNADVRTEIPNNTTFAIRFMRAANGVYCWFDGTFDY